jgi:hypothetical protein
MRSEEPLEPPLFGQGWSKGIRWVASLGGAAITAIWVLSTTAGANQRVVWLMERARPACAHSQIDNEELHAAAQHELETGSSKQDALRAIVNLCQARLRS